MNRIATCIPIALLAAALCLVAADPAHAQGTANGWITQHVIQPGTPPQMIIGDDNPVPIDLDPNGKPWTKEIFAPPGVTIQPGQVISLKETIINSGKETWTDWHEHVLPTDPTGAGFPGVWVDVRAAVNGVPTTFGLGGLNTPNVWLDPIDTPVQPGDIFEVSKIFQFTTAVDGNPDVPVLVIQEYPTPEPATMTLVGLSGLAFLARRRKRATA